MVRGAGRGVAGLVLFLAACTGSSSTSPATAPDVTTTEAQATSAATATTSTAPPTTLAPPTTVDRLVEIEAIFADLEFRRLDALYQEDEEAFRALFANEAYLEQSLAVLDADLGFAEPPTPTSFELIGFEVLVDSEECLAAQVTEDTPELFLDSVEPQTSIRVLTKSASGEWGLAYIGSGWLCDGPHPLDP